MPQRLEGLVDGGKAAAGPPLGPALGPLGLNILQVVKDVNDRTKAFEGMKVPVVLLIDAKTKTYTIEVGTPPASALTLKEAIRVANIKGDAMAGKGLKQRVAAIVGTCVSMGVTVEGKPAKDVSKEILAGKYDKELAG